MKRTIQCLAGLFCLSLLVILSSCTKDKPRVGIAGIAIECSTFSPALTPEEAFRIRSGEQVMGNYDFFKPGSPLLEKATWLPAMTARATPGGALTLETYESLVGQILDQLKENLPYDALFLDIHGAMSVVGLDDPEGDFIVRVRELVGKDVLISTCMDPHGNVTTRLAQNTDLITCYRLSPHEDSMESRERAVTNLMDRLESGKGKPAYKAWVPIPILLPGEQTSTRVEPAKSLSEAIQPATERDGVIDGGFWIGYAWADEPRNHAVVMFTGDNKDELIRTTEEIAKHFWDVRKEFEFVAPVASLEESLDQAIAADKEHRPFFISDTGDNPTAGGAGDVTWTLTEILKRKEFQHANGPGMIYASIPGPELVAAAKAAGVGNPVKGIAGAEVDDRYAPPVELSGIVTAIKDVPGDSEAVIKIGSISVIVTDKRKGFHYEKQMTDLNLDPRNTDIVVVKLGYLVPEWYDMQKGWVMALTYGGVNQDLHNLPYERIQRPMFPLDPDMADPDLSARLIPSSAD